MKRTTWIMALLAILLLSFAGSPNAAGAITPTPTSDTTTTTPTIGPSPTVTPKAKPRAAMLWRKSLKAMATLRQVHAEGTVTDGFGAKDAVSLTADCDSHTHRAHLLASAVDSRGVPFSIDIIVTASNVWIRRQTGNGAWSTWQAPNGDTEGATFYLLFFLLPQSCPQQYIAKGKVPSQLKNLGPGLVDGAATWRLRVRAKTHEGLATLSLNVDQTTYLWRQFGVSLIARKKKDTFIENTRYSRFNVPVDIEPPTISPTPTPTPRLGQ